MNALTYLTLRSNFLRSILAVVAILIAVIFSITVLGGGSANAISHTASQTQIVDKGSLLLFDSSSLSGALK